MLEFAYLLMIFLQIIHIFEEIAMEGYKVINKPLSTYLRVATLLVFLNFAGFGLILADNPIGFYLGIFCSGVLALGNGLVHTIGYLVTRKMKEGIGAGIYSSIPLGIVGAWVLMVLVRGY